MKYIIFTLLTFSMNSLYSNDNLEYLIEPNFDGIELPQSKIDEISAKAGKNSKVTIQMIKSFEDAKLDQLRSLEGQRKELTNDIAKHQQRAKDLLDKAEVDSRNAAKLKSEANRINALSEKMSRHLADVNEELKPFHSMSKAEFALKYKNDPRFIQDYIFKFDTSKKSRDKLRTELMAKIKKGDRVVFISRPRVKSNQLVKTTVKRQPVAAAIMMGISALSFDMDELTPMIDKAITDNGRNPQEKVTKTSGDAETKYTASSVFGL